MEKLIESLKVIQGICKGQEDCLKCPLCRNGEDCSVTYNEPQGWDIQEKPIQRVLL